MWLLTIFINYGISGVGVHDDDEVTAQLAAAGPIGECQRLCLKEFLFTKYHITLMVL